MKKINSIGYGHKILAVIIILLAGIPLGIWFVSCIFDAPGLMIAAKISFALGCLLSVGFLVFLKIELRQDKKMNDHYAGQKNVKLAVRGGYECSNCGNRNVRANDRYCSSCNIIFRE